MGREDFFSFKITEEPEAERRENLQIQDLVSDPFIILPSEHQDLNWSQAGGDLSLGGSLESWAGTSRIQVVLAEMRNRHMMIQMKKDKHQRKKKRAGGMKSETPWPA